MGQLETATQIWKYLVGCGWSKTAVAGMLGNMQSESSLIPDIWQNNDIGNMNVGYGLVQWTPASEYINWAQSHGLDYRDVYSQLKRLEWEVENNMQFICSFMTFYQFKVSNESPEYLADTFMKYYERPLKNQPERAQQARYWYDKLEGINPTPSVKVVDWFNRNRGHITYSMDGSRIGTDGTADCSGSITIAVKESTGIPYAYVYNTVTLGDYLNRCGYRRVLIGNQQADNLDQIGDEDIMLFSCGNSMADSGGAGGHTGVISHQGNMITSTCYLTQGAPNTAIQDVAMLPVYLKENNFHYYEVWRPSGNPTPGPIPPSFSTNVHYSLRVCGGQWLSEVTNFNNIDYNGFAGLPYHKHDLLYIKVDEGDLRYRVHTVESGWLPWVDKGDPNDPINGCAGNPGEAIDGVQIYYTTPAGKPLSQSYYRSQTVDLSGWLNVCCDDGTSIPGFDGWAGLFGEPLDRLQIGISKSSPY